MFETFRKSLEEFLNRATPPEDRRDLASRMRDTLVRAKMGVADLRDGVTATKASLEREQREVETMRRRQRLATDAGDADTAALAERHAGLHADRADILARKLDAQEAELALGERDVREMTDELRRALDSVPAPATSLGSDALGGDDPVASELDAMARSRERATRESEAEQRLAELKRRMGR